MPDDAHLLGLVADLRTLDAADRADAWTTDRLPRHFLARAEIEVAIIARQPRRDAILHAIADLPATTPAGVVAKATVASMWLGPDLSDLAPAERVGAELLRQLAEGHLPGLTS